MRHFFVFLLALFTLPTCIAAPPTEHTPVQRGSLTNVTLMNDAKMGVVTKVGTMGCTQLDGFTPWIMKMPTGQPGSRVWHERWIVTGCGNTYPIDIRFNEAGLNAADWTIE